MQEKISASDPLLKLYVAIDDDVRALQPRLWAKQVPADPRGGPPALSAAEVLTILVWGADAGSRIRPRAPFTCSPIIGTISRP